MKSLFAACIILATVGGLFASMCYECSYIPTVDSGSECNDPFEPSNTTAMCEGTFCMKSTSHFGGEMATLARSCSEVCMELCASLFGIEGCAYCCEGDLCNGAESLTFSLITIVSMVKVIQELSV